MLSLPRGHPCLPDTRAIDRAPKHGPRINAGRCHVAGADDSFCWSLCVARTWLSALVAPVARVKVVVWTTIACMLAGLVTLPFLLPSLKNETGVDWIQPYWLGFAAACGSAALD